MDVMANTNTVNRGWLKRQVLAGKMEIRCTGRYTDDYAGDAYSNFGRTSWVPVAIVNSDGHYVKDGVYGVYESMFTGSSGRAWRNSDGTIALVVAGDYYDFRVKA